ncbi:hypothetical protein ACHAQF_006947 [Verticillium nonalfalfae]
MITTLFSEQVTAVPLVAALFVLYLARTVIAWAKLRQFTGPRWTGVSNIPHGKAALSEKCHEWYAKVSKEHGPIARIAPGILLTSSPEVWAHVNRQAGYKRSEWYYNACRVEYRRDNVFTQSDNAKHEQRRKQMAPGYSGRENPGLEASIDERLEDLLKLVRTKYISTPDRIVPMDLAKKVQFFTLDVISAVGLGKTFGMLAADEDVDSYLQSSEEGLAAANAAWALGASWLAQSPVLGRFIAPSPRDNNGFGKMMATCFRFVDERVARGDTDKRSDMLASFIRHGLRDDELKSEALEQIIAGSDTTAGAIRGALLLVMTNPRVYALLQKEIDAAVREGRAPAVGNGLISQAQAKELPFLQAVVRESLRVRTPVANLFPRDVPAGGDTVVVDGERIALPGGVCIGYSAYAMHRDEALYGDDAQAFRPERWFEDDKDKLAAMVRTNDMVFGDGRFTCLGKPVAQMEMAKTIFENESDVDSDEGIDNESFVSSTASLTSSMLEYRQLHGRTFQSYKSTEYWGPNDDRQNDGLDIAHHFITLLLGDKLYEAPIDEPKRVLDVGTGTGIWAIDVADAHPAAEVTGFDISPIQPSWVPPNCKFHIDDAQLEWTYPAASFDLIHIRALYGSIGDWPKLYGEAFRALEPGGYLENFEFTINLRSDLPSVRDDPKHVFKQWGQVFTEAMDRLGKTAEIGLDGRMKRYMEQAGFEDIVVKDYQLPCGGWSSDPRLKEVGIYNLAFLEESLEGFALFLLKEIMGWEYIEIQLLVANMRKAIRDLKLRPYYIVPNVYGRKPLTAE